MARFDVYVSQGSKVNTPYLVDVQNDFLAGLTSRVVVPLLRAESFPPGKRPADFTPCFEIGGIRCLMHPAFLGSVPLNELDSAVGSLGEHRASITAALDHLLGEY